MQRPKNYLEYNKNAWNHLVKSGNRWTLPFGDEIIQAAKNGEWKIVLTPSWPVPHEWFQTSGKKLLGLASGGGQQCPVLAAAGFEVTVFDNSQEQLNQDILMAEKHQLNIKTIQGDMADLSVFADESFDIVFNPCSTGFVPDVKKVYKEVGRILKKGGVFMTGFTKPVYYLFDIKLAESGVFTLKYSSPYSDLDSLDDEELSVFLNQNEPVVFGHSLEDHINGQIQAGLEITEIREDNWGGNNPIDKYFPAFVATRAVKKY